MRRLFLLIAGSLFVNYASAQLQHVNGYAAAPDDWLLSQGQQWHYHTNTASKSKQLNFRAS